jgi:hypothetical protein
MMRGGGSQNIASMVTWTKVEKPGNSLLRRGPEKAIGNPREWGKKRPECGGTRFLKEGAPRTAIMHNRASCYIEGSRPQDACWLHAEWTRTPSGKNFYNCWRWGKQGFPMKGRLSSLPVFFAFGGTGI